eukprot:gnl/TRDRNA2_/TRDRNA2_163933_c0_seq1.p1 gnl/TRDRNA2_/TRDRNA2_163933_c0~~gnl/TRDRNA2_/TRDRNA2_163933_c0_seq1.p1  ORF type:complete len:467 (-),score=79.02 gnl/TRDRNA2_/TRDRNA2_163933_c0_seq1:54-1454(-)
MLAKERREFGRRTLLPTMGDSSDDVDVLSTRTLRQGERMPPLPPPNFKDPFRMSQSVLSPSVASSSSAASSPSAQSGCSGGRKKTRTALQSSSASATQNAVVETLQTSLSSKVMHSEVLERIICDGIRVVIFGEDPAQVPTGLCNLRLDEPGASQIMDEIEVKVRSPATREETIKVYKMYRSLIKHKFIDHTHDLDDHDDGALVCETEHPRLDDFATSNVLQPIEWSTLFNWIQHESDFARHYRFKAACCTLLRALKLWRKQEATPVQRATGIALSTLLHWIWPSMTYDGVANMLTWICELEFNKIRQPTPPVIEDRYRAQLESIFEQMDTNKKGYCTAHDVAGGEHKDVIMQLKNIVDVETVRAVCGRKDVCLGRADFVDLMCEPNYRPYQDSTVVVCDHGQKLIKVTRPIVGFTGWLYDVAPTCETAQRNLVDSIEQEVLRWKNMSKHRRAAVPSLADVAISAG